MANGTRRPSPFLDSIADLMTVRRYSKRTMKSYLYWIRSFITSNDKRQPEEM